MTDKIDDGGQVFPLPGHQDRGLTTRQYFAGLAMQGVMASETQGDGLMIAYAKWKDKEGGIHLANAIECYKWADAMIKAGEGSP